jgi:hypothetical protein
MNDRKSETPNDLELRFRSFLKAEPVVPDSPREVRALLEHAADCPSCGLALKERPEHAALLLGFYDDADEEQAEGGPDLNRRREVMASADEILSKLPEALRGAFSAPLRSDRAKALLAAEGDRDPSRLRAAFVVSEAMLVLGTMVDAEPLKFDRVAEVVVSKSARFPFQPLAERIAESAELPLPLAEALWEQVLDLLSRDLAGLPGFTLRDATSSWILIEEESTLVPLESVPDDSDVDEEAAAFAAMSSFSQEAVEMRQYVDLLSNSSDVECSFFVSDGIDTRLPLEAEAKWEDLLNGVFFLATGAAAGRPKLDIRVHEDLSHGYLIDFALPFNLDANSEARRLAASFDGNVAADEIHIPLAAVIKT